MLKNIFADLSSDEQIYVWRRSPNTRFLFDSVAEVEKFVTDNQDSDIYFGVCPRVKGNYDAVSRATALWADYDSKDFKKQEEIIAAINGFPLPPSALLFSGHGYHAYWFLSSSIRGEDAQTILRVLCRHTGADHTHDPTRVMRLPYSKNWKDQEDVKDVSILYVRPDRRYIAGDIYGVIKLNSRTVRLISSGELSISGKQIFKSRSERDWFIMRELISCGVSDAGIKQVFESNPIRDRYDENDWRLFPYELEKARGAFSSTESTKFTEVNGCLFYDMGKGNQQVSTFSFTPERLLVDQENSREDALLGTVTCNGKVWTDVVFPKSAFASASNLIKMLPAMEWIWLGNDFVTKQFLSFLLAKLHEKGGATSITTSVLGRHDEYWVAKEVTLTAQNMYRNSDAPVSYQTRQAVRHLDSGKVTPSLSYSFPEAEEFKEYISKVSLLLPQTNEESVILPILGWFCAALIKPLLRAGDIRFPHLNIFGTRGSGKTATLLYTMMPLLGITDPVTWTPNTTTFVMRSLLSGTNAIPVIFGEYRSSTVDSGANDFLRILLMAYDAGVDARGKSDLSTETYRLDAPIIVDGEDAFSDPAAKERAIMVNLHPEVVREGSACYDAFVQLQKYRMADFAGRFVQHTLNETVTGITQRFENALQEVRTTYPLPMPDRVRKNIAVVVLGLSLYNEFVESWGGTTVSWTDKTFLPMLETILLTLQSGMSRALVDDFIEDIVAYIAACQQHRTIGFIFAYDEVNNVLWFHLKSALSWWERERRMRGRNTLEIIALRSQLNERAKSSGYILSERVIGGKIMRNTPCFGLKLEDAASTGLSIPSDIGTSYLMQIERVLVNKYGMS